MHAARPESPAAEGPIGGRRWVRAAKITIRVAVMLLVGGTGCGGESIRRDSGGAAFELNGQETTLADQYDQQNRSRPT